MEGVVAPIVAIHIDELAILREGLAISVAIHQRVVVVLLEQFVQRAIGREFFIVEISVADR